MFGWIVSVIFARVAFFGGCLYGSTNVVTPFAINTLTPSRATSLSFLLRTTNKMLCFQSYRMDIAFKYDESSEGLCLEKDWPYAHRKHHFFGCHFGKKKCTVVPQTKVESYVDVAHSSLALKTAISKQPVSVAIMASGVRRITRDLCHLVFAVFNLVFRSPLFRNVLHTFSRVLTFH